MKTRLLASGTHLLASAAVISLFLALVYLVWYPDPLYKLHATFEALKIVILVDLVLGPLITMIIFDISKPRRELVRDISIIVLVQVIALGWGMHIVYKVRPVFVVFNDGTLHSVTRDDIKKYAPDYSPVPGIWEKPHYVYTRALGTKEAVQHVMDMMNKGIPDVMYQTERYLPLMEHKDEVLADALNRKRLDEKLDSPSQLPEFVGRHGGKVDDYAFYPIEYGPFSSVVAVDRESLKIKDLVIPVR